MQVDGCLEEVLRTYAWDIRTKWLKDAGIRCRRYGTQKCSAGYLWFTSHLNNISQGVPSSQVKEYIMTHTNPKPPSFGGALFLFHPDIRAVSTLDARYVWLILKGRGRPLLFDLSICWAQGVGPVASHGRRLR